jgi:5-methylthioadenosine/S-adenosylhomocysteine deaminase
MFNVMRLAATLHKEGRVDPTVIPAATALAMGTQNGARACQWDDLGHLTPGARADVVVVDLMQPHMVPVHDVINNLVYCANAQDVVTTIVDGNVLMEDRQMCLLDEPSVLDDARSHAERIAHRISAGSEKPKRR